MKAIINQTDNVVSDMLNGFYFEHQHRLTYDQDHQIISEALKTNQVALISGGGSGHEPAHFGYVADGMLTTSVSGRLFTPPSVEQILKAIQMSDVGDGVLLIVKNFASDVEMFQKAKEQAVTQGHSVETVIVDDDVSIEDQTHYKKRKRGVAGTIFVYKLLGAYARNGASLDTLKKVGDHITEQLHTLGVALSPAHLPVENQSTFTLDESEVYYGVGIHGEKGYRKEPFESSEQLAVELINKLKSIYMWKPGERFACLINGLGSTPLMEQYIFSHDVKRLMEIEGLKIDFFKVGTHMSSYNMAGISLSLLKLIEADWANYLQEPTNAPNW
ncbi:dihydroxyacetone kinase [Pelagirhabdus alkalitolerans]|uniref:DhaKLM operon coactivator DhaQ n=1 Tax=Pelagirhabdus alkalitolerans TaxID=1612202 RepID=A0A1G6KVS6_9BACI|nr:DhaKLM operon coactivator DhaQ [Pelagirhabdus alkalitolerans]SDC35190.1 dihydroxyacetone kinase [Pelagirhabdus alkalitolerans]